MFNTIKYEENKENSIKSAIAARIILDNETSVFQSLESFKIKDGVAELKCTNGHVIYSPITKVIIEMLPIDKIKINNTEMIISGNMKIKMVNIDDDKKNNE